ncbi:hypothetical protein [Rothia sp. CCM 9416]|uniref:hypothetical protein n=1 Tax=Rothia sp. CCM 9416 TaxID=3402655 RepID=UPI003ADFFF87
MYFKSSLGKVLVISMASLGALTACGGGNTQPNPTTNPTANATTIEQEFKTLTQGTITATGTEPTLYTYPSKRTYTPDYLHNSYPIGSCGKDKLNLSVMLNTSQDLTPQQYQEKIDKVYTYWKTQNLQPKYFRPAGNGISIMATTPTGGEITYMASQYGEMYTFDTVCNDVLQRKEPLDWNAPTDKGY